MEIPQEYYADKSNGRVFAKDLIEKDLFANPEQYIKVTPNSKERPKSTDVPSLLDAIEFAAIKHKKQRRKNKDQDPYIIHPIGVANLISKVGQVNDVNVLIAAVLHDTVEDTKTTFEEIEQKFNTKIANIVREVTDDKKLDKVERKKLQIIHASNVSYEAKLVKLADKLHNMTSLLTDPPAAWSWEIIQGYFVWSKFVVDALKGTNTGLETELAKVFAGKFICDGLEYPALPIHKTLNEDLSDYYKLL